MILRALTYARVSTRKRRQDPSIARQTSELRDVAKRKGWRLLAEHSDRLSGGNSARPGLRGAMTMIRRRKADVLVVHDLDRLGRDVQEMLANADAIHAAGAHLFILDRLIDTTTPAGRLAFTINSAYAEFMRRDTARKVIAGIAYARKKGVRLGRPPAIEGEALARAVTLRRCRPRPSWSSIVLTLRAEKLGKYAKGTLAGAVTRALARLAKGRLKSPPKTARKKPGKKAARRARRKASSIT